MLARAEVPRPSDFFRRKTCFGCLLRPLSLGAVSQGPTDGGVRCRRRCGTGGIPTGRRRPRRDCSSVRADAPPPRSNGRECRARPVGEARVAPHGRREIPAFSLDSLQPVIPGGDNTHPEGRHARIQEESAAAEPFQRPKTAGPVGRHPNDDVIPACTAMTCSTDASATTWPWTGNGAPAPGEQRHHI